MNPPSATSSRCFADRLELHGRPFVALTGTGCWADQVVDEAQPGDRIVGGADPDQAVATFDALIER